MNGAAQSGASGGARSDEPARSPADLVGPVFEALRLATRTSHDEVRAVARGRIIAVRAGVAWATGLNDAGFDEVVHASGGVQGRVFDLSERRAGLVLLDAPDALSAGDRVIRTGRVLDVPVGEPLLGRIVDALGRPIDDGPPLRGVARRPIEQPAPGILERSPVRQPVQTGITVIDAFVPIGRGQRELIVGDRETGKTSIALDAIRHQSADDVVCLYCSVGQRHSATARVIDELRRCGALGHTVVMASGGDDSAGLRFVAPYAAMSIAEQFMAEGRHVLLVLDDLTRHARSYRELSLLLRRSPGREGYPGDIFHIHARLLERATQLDGERGGGSITALPIVETQAEDISAYIPTNLISITDGQIYLAPELVRRGIFPAVDVGRSVSRVGADAQLPAYRTLSGRLRLDFTQFLELERFSRFAGELDPASREALRRGRAIREILRQPRGQPRGPHQQIALLLATVNGAFDKVEPERLVDAVEAVLRGSDRRPEWHARMRSGAQPDEGDVEWITQLVESTSA